MVYLPAGTSAMRKLPWSSDTVFKFNEAIVTSALGTTAPTESSTRPSMLPLPVLCACMEKQARTSRSRLQTKRRNGLGIQSTQRVDGADIHHSWHRPSSRRKARQHVCWHACSLTKQSKFNLRSVTLTYPIHGKLTIAA